MCAWRIISGCVFCSRMQRFRRRYLVKDAPGLFNSMKSFKTVFLYNCLKQCFSTFFRWRHTFCICDTLNCPKGQFWLNRISLGPILTYSSSKNFFIHQIFWVKLENIYFNTFRGSLQHTNVSQHPGWVMV